jgi:hypothetical protein
MAPFRPSTPDFTKACSLFRGEPVVLDVSGPVASRLVVFEDDGTTGCFYAVETPDDAAPRIIDAVFVYDSPGDGSAAPEIAEIRWSADGSRAALFLSGVAEAAFDFGSRRGYGRSAGPTGRQQWDPAILAGLD